MELVTSDAHQGLKNAIAAVFAVASWQRCRTHFMANLLTRVPKRAQPSVATQDILAWYAPSTSTTVADLTGGVCNGIAGLWLGGAVSTATRTG